MAGCFPKGTDSLEAAIVSSVESANKGIKGSSLACAWLYSLTAPSLDLVNISSLDAMHLQITVDIELCFPNMASPFFPFNITSLLQRPSFLTSLSYSPIYLSSGDIWDLQYELLTLMLFSSGALDSFCTF